MKLVIRIRFMSMKSIEAHTTKAGMPSSGHSEDGRIDRDRLNVLTRH